MDCPESSGHLTCRCPPAEPARQRPRRHSLLVNCQASQRPPRSGHALLDVPGTADCGAASLLRSCAMTSQLKTVCVADGERAQEKSDAAMCHPRLGCAQDATEVQGSRKEYRFRPHAGCTNTPPCFGRYAQSAGETRTLGGRGPGIRLPDTHASRRGQPPARREQNSRKNHLADVSLRPSAARARRCSLARMRAPLARPCLTARRPQSRLP
jgi:hypothetical protein